MKDLIDLNFKIEYSRSSNFVDNVLEEDPANIVSATLTLLVSSAPITTHAHNNKGCTQTRIFKSANINTTKIDDLLQLRG